MERKSGGTEPREARHRPEETVYVAPHGASEGRSSSSPSASVVSRLILDSNGLGQPPHPARPRLRDRHPLPQGGEGIVKVTRDRTLARWAIPHAGAPLTGLNCGGLQTRENVTVVVKTGT